MDKKPTTTRLRHDSASQVPARLSPSASGASSRLKTTSLSKSLQNIFCRKYSGTVKQGHCKKGNKLFESINGVDGVNVDHVRLRRSSRPRVWSVRNSFSKSPVETVSRELLKIGSPAKVKKENKRSKTCSYAFDVFNSFNDLILANEENFAIKRNIQNSANRLKCTGDQTNFEIQEDQIQDDHSGNIEHFGSFDETLDRSRLSSFGSSACYSDASGCNCSVSSCSGCNQEKSDNDNVAMETDVNTSYWDLRLPTESSFRRPGLNSRRYSLSVVTEHQTEFGSPEMRTYLAKRRSSEQPSMYKGMRGNNHNLCWQDKFLHAMNSEDCYFKEAKDFIETDSVEMYNDDYKNIAIDIPRVHRINQVRRSSSACGDIRRSKSINRSQRPVEEESLDRRHVQRSRSVDSSCKRRLFHSRERQPSRSSTCQFAFSDIESSEESESSPDPTESSSDGRQQSSCNDTSSLSASSMSGSSSNERNTPITSKRKTLNSSPSKSVKYSDIVSVGNIGLAENSYISLNEKIADKDSEIELKKTDDKTYTQKTEERGKEIDRSMNRSSDIQNLEALEKFTDVLDGAEENTIQIVDSGFDKILALTHVVDSVEGNKNAQEENCSNSLTEEIADKDFKIDLIIRHAEEKCTDKTEGKCEEIDRSMTAHLDIKNLDGSGKLTDLPDGVEENSKQIVDSVYDKNLALTNEVDSVESYKNAQEAVKSSSYQTKELSEDPENKNLIDYAEDSPEHDLGTDVDLLFEEQYEIEDLCLDMLYSEIDTEDRRNEEMVDTENRSVMYNHSNVNVNDFQKIGQSLKKDTEKLETAGIDEKDLIDFDEEIYTVVESQKAGNNCSTSEDDKLTEIEGLSDVDFEKYDINTSQIPNDKDMIDDKTEIDHVLNIFDSVLHDELEQVKQSQEEKIDSGDTDDIITVNDEIVGDELSKEMNDISEETAAKQYPCNRTCTETVCANVENTDISEDLNERNKVSEMTDESIQVGDFDEHDNNLEFWKGSLEEILFNSGKVGTTSDAVDIVDDVDSVFEAINREIIKEENKDKDMIVVFIVGGELKVIRRSGTLLNGSHGDSRQTDIPSMTRKERPQQNGSQDYVFTRSVHDINRGRPKSAIIVTRSQSFNGMANQQLVMGGRRESPQAVVLGESFRHHRGGPPMQAPRATPGSRGAVGFSFKKSPKVPKVPRPNRALLMFQSVKRGIREFIEATNQDIDQLQHRETDHTSTAQGKLHEADKQIKSAERYLKRLEFHLAKLDELHEYYMLQQQLREGVRTMHRAYVTSPGNQAHSLTNVKYGYKECTQTMCNIEAQLEAMMGTFNCKLKGMAGFARLCPGDVFEVTVRHGTQKWKTKGRIEKTGNQKWDVPEFNFKAVVGDIFNIKGLEVRAFKSVLLGQKSCETKDLFSANPQLMTVSINVNGSLKLSIVITWNPLDGVEESFNFMETPQRAQGTPRRRPVSVIALNGQYDAEPGVDRQHPTPVTIQQTKDDNFILRTNPSASHHVNNVTSYHGLDSPHVSARLSEHLPDAYRQTGPIYTQTSHHIQAGFHSSPAFPTFGESDSDKQLPHPPTQNSAFSNSLPPVMGHLHFPSVSPHAVSSTKEEEENIVLNIEDVLHTLTSSLEDYHGQYTELQKLEDLVKFAHKLIRKQFRSSSRSSSISVSIESALEAFDFLDTEEAFEEPRSPTENLKANSMDPDETAWTSVTFVGADSKQYGFQFACADVQADVDTYSNVKASFDDMLCSPESTAKTGDSGIESLAQRLSEDTQLGSSLGSSPVPPSTGNEEVDQCLLYHLTYCERLLENLGAFGPLKCREIYALDKLQKQCTIVESLLKLAKSGPHVDLHSVMTGICEDKSLREFWVKCTDQNSLYIHPDRLLNMLEQKFSSVIADRHMIDPVKVCQHVITRVLDIPDYEAERGRSWFLLTLHQLMLYFNEEGGLKHIEDVAEEMKLVEKLTSGNPDIVIKAILTLRDTLPSSPCLKVIGMLLVTMDKEVEQCTLSYLNLIQRKKENREKAMITFVEGLEDRTPEIRSGACAALAILEASESIELLEYLWQSDPSAMVQKCAKETLLALGDEGRKAFEDAQLSKHGFQGIQVHK